MSPGLQRRASIDLLETHYLCFLAHLTTGYREGFIRDAAVSSGYRNFISSLNKTASINILVNITQ